MLLLLLLLSRFSRVQLCATPPGSPIPGILQARTLEWVAIAFSENATWFDTKEIQWTSVHNVGVCVGDRRTDIELGTPVPLEHLHRRRDVEAIPPAALGAGCLAIMCDDHGSGHCRGPECNYTSSFTDHHHESPNAAAPQAHLSSTRNLGKPQQLCLLFRC